MGFCLPIGSFSVNPFYLRVAFHIETRHLICSANQMIGFFMKRNSWVKWFYWTTFCTNSSLFYYKVLTSIQQLSQKVRTGTLLFTLGHNSDIERFKDVQKTLRSFYGLCPGGTFWKRKWEMLGIYLSISRS